MRKIASIVPCILLPLAFGAAAEKADREKEIVVNADRLVADDAKKTSAFEGNVVVTQGTMRMTAAKVTVREDPEHHKYYVANGSPVTFRQKLDNSEEWMEGYAQRAEFDDLNDVLRLYRQREGAAQQERDHRRLHHLRHAQGAGRGHRRHAGAREHHRRAREGGDPAAAAEEGGSRPRRRARAELKPDEGKG